MSLLLLQSCCTTEHGGTNGLPSKTALLSARSSTQWVFTEGRLGSWEVLHFIKNSCFKVCTIKLNTMNYWYCCMTIHIMMCIKIIPDVLVLCGDIIRVIKQLTLILPFCLRQDCFVSSSLTSCFSSPFTHPFFNPTGAHLHLLQSLLCPPSSSSLLYSTVWLEWYICCGTFHLKVFFLLI